MTRKRVLLLALPLSFLLAFPVPAGAACVNKYVAKKSGGIRYTFTLLTGMLDFEDATKLAEAIASGAHGPLVWVTEEGKTVAEQVGELKVVRPMPVACEGKTSGVVVNATFMTNRSPSDVVRIVFDPDLTVAFEKQQK